MQAGRYLVTGGLGQVGSYITESLLTSGAEVVILDDLSSNGRDSIPGSRLVKGDIRDRALVKDLVKDVDAIVHCAAQIFVARSVEDPSFDADNNIFGTINLLDAARNANIRRFVYFSSAAVYGDPLRLPVDEEHPQNPMSPYGVSKLSGEKYALAFQKIYGVHTTAIRPFNIYSPRQDPSNPYSGVISKFIDRASQGQPPIIFGDGTATRDFVSVHDVVQMVMLMLEKEAAVGKVFNCGTGHSTTIGQLARTIISLYGNEKLEPELHAERPGDIKYSYADISRARELLGYKPEVVLENGLREIVESKNMD
ncbi:GDP-mannose 4,6-dehydratase [Methanocella arvoryzae]|uniref:UDP-glucose 4-epimerase n=1 Tax=Methanocella arvoryzae (strain DSM 22066 / NBRC 105507 / MRE50) TaxID=351160 RepID=Q0W4H9_METAR|nr:GDP-mannose 4,6-dehydratase [Methanocella arvoryzae]CAJ36714.1 putative UDP-glucose 4-epimerase [Methanocella arvoryzae MRE50]